MKIAYANVRALNTSFNPVETACLRQQIKILGLSNIWHPDSNVKDSVKQDWNWIATERKEGRGGGVALMISKEKIYERKDLKCSNLEAVWCNVYSSEGFFLVGSVYIPPNDTKSLKAIFKVMNGLRDNQSPPFVLVGDFNAHYPYWYVADANKLGDELFEYLVDKNYILKHFRNAPLYFLLFLPHGLVEDIFLVIYHVRVQ